LLTFLFAHGRALFQESTMYAVFEDGSRQYRVSEGDVVRVDLRSADVGARLEFNRVLLYQNGDDTRIGRPLVEGVRVLGEVVGTPSERLYVQHFRRRKNYRRLRGHRQKYTAVQIRSILLPGQEPPPAPPEPAAAQPPPAPPEPAAAQPPPAPPEPAAAPPEAPPPAETPPPGSAN
jgi:large subunit ribosomal protein L21